MIVLVLGWRRGVRRDGAAGAHKLIRHLAGDGGIASEWLPRGIILFDSGTAFFPLYAPFSGSYGVRSSYNHYSIQHVVV